MINYKSNVMQLPFTAGQQSWFVVYFNNKYKQRCGPTQYDPTADQSLQRRGLFQEDIRQEHIKNGAEGPADRVESHADMFQTQVVEGDHADEDDRQRQDLPGRLQVELDGREVDGSGAELGQQLHEPTQADGHHALVESDEQRRVQVSVVQQVVVEEHHCYRDKPVKCDHSGYPDCSE